MENLLASWQEFLRGKRRRRDVSEFSLRFIENIFQLHKNLAEQTYRHGGYQAFNISDPKSRRIHKANVRDRLVHHAICRVLYPYFDRKFIFDSYSCRLNKGTHRAMNRFHAFSRRVSRNNTRSCWVLKGDIKKFFASIDHVILNKILEKHINDREILWLLRQIIDSFSLGLPLGNLTSQLLVNVYMNEFDQFMKRKLKVQYYIRFADDFIVLDYKKAGLKKLLPEIYLFLKQELRLSLHPNKVSIKTITSGVDFLGWVHFPHHRILRTATKNKMLKKIRQNAKQETLVSYHGLLSHGNTHKLTQKYLIPYFQNQKILRRSGVYKLLAEGLLEV